MLVPSIYICFKLKFCSQKLKLRDHSLLYDFYCLKYFQIFLIAVEAAMWATRTSDAQNVGKITWLHNYKLFHIAELQHLDGVFGHN